MSPLVDGIRLRLTQASITFFHKDAYIEVKLHSAQVMTAAYMRIPRGVKALPLVQHNAAHRSGASLPCIVLYALLVGADDSGYTL